MNSVNISNFSNKWKSLFDKITKLARDKMFLQRVSKLKPSLLLKTVIHGQLEYERPSLKNYCQIFHEISKKTISFNGFDKRINTRTIEFMRAFLHELLAFASRKIKSIPFLLKSFSEVYLLDSTQIKLINDSKDKYKGSNGSASESAMKIQCLFNVLRGKYDHFTISDGVSPDQKFGEKIVKSLRFNSLILFDLGYTTFSFIIKLIQKGVYFVSRFPHYNYRVFNIASPDQEIDLLNVLQENKSKIVEMTVLLGKQRIPGRIIAFPLKKSVIEKRQKEAIEKSKKRGRKAPERHLKFLEWSIYFTNAPNEVIRTKDIYPIYRLRWRIELIFKVWKSKLDLGYLSGQRIERIEFELFAKLISLTFYNLFTVPVLDLLENAEVEISEIVCIKIFKKGSA